MRTVLKIIADSHAPDARLAKEIRSLANYGFHIDVICWDRDRSNNLSSFENNYHGSVYRMQKGAGRGSAFKYVFRLFLFYIYTLNMYRKVKPDFVHIHSLQVLPLGALLKIISRIKLIYDVHEITETFGVNVHNKLGVYITRIERFFLSYVDGIVVATEALEDRYKAWTKNKISVITLLNCLDFEPVIKLKDYQTDTLVLGRIGSLRPKSRFDILAEAIKMVNDRGYKTYFHYAGTAVSGYEEVRRKYHKKIQEFSTYTPWVAVTDFSEFYSKVHAIINIHETGDPLEEKFVYFSKVFEASAYGVPSIINDYPSMSPIINKHGIGVVVPNETIEAFADAIIALHKRKKILGQFSRNCELFVKEYVNWGIMEERLISFYKKLSNQCAE
ncbi:glycosyltransferase [uncultured Roseivirga sp.]|mgnify:CR=1 FL=1|uniref:glycosyltransferase n=1 Tax=uncultured Roseivirga sp. TaxID=543088 RepID=UPI00258D4F38|nr:glycosyltransferase [uncultured Roseivirga sp.]